MDNYCKPAPVFTKNYFSETQSFPLGPTSVRNLKMKVWEVFENCWEIASFRKNQWTKDFYLK